MIPQKVRVLWLKGGTKVPDFTKSPHGNLSSVPWTQTTRPEGNYGINLDGDFIVVDFDCDHEDRQAVESSLPATWTQRTGRQDAVGMHYLYRVPSGYVGLGKRVLTGKDGRKIADVKAKGYIVGPGSIVAGNMYRMVREMEPAPAPDWLLKFAKESPKTSSSGEGGRGGIPNGEHDEFLFRMSSWLRGQADLSEGAIQRVLRKGPLAALEDVDETRPYEDTDLARIAHSAGRYAPLNALQESSLSPDTWKTLADIDTHKNVTAWWLYRFVPKNELVTLYGPGGIGKSSWASWLASEVVSAGGRFGFSGVEEPFLRFGVRANMSGKDLAVEKIVDIGNQWVFPRDADKLREALTNYPLDVIYFDSIYNHFEPIEGLNMAERTRACLSPLASIAQDMKTTIIGTFHENKAGDFLGSVEMVNVARVVLKASRPEGKPYKLIVKKTNFMEPGHGLTFEGSPEEGRALDGTPWLEVGPDGQEIPEVMFVMKTYNKSSGDVERDDPVFEVEELEEPPEYQVREILKDDPNISVRGLAKLLGWGEKKSRYWLDKTR